MLLLQSALEAKVTAATVRWVGAGRWTPDNICFDWDNENYQVWTCVNQNHTSLARGEAVQLKCNESSKFRCIGFLSI